MSKFYQDPETVSGRKEDYGIVEDPDLHQPGLCNATQYLYATSEVLGIQGL